MYASLRCIFCENIRSELVTPGRRQSHKCHICQIVRIECSHSKLKCRNCGENHKSNNQICSIWKKQTSLSASPAKSDIAMKNSADFAVIISHVKW